MSSEFVVRGNVGFVVPTIRDDYSPELKEALARRNTATIEGHCPCGAKRVLESGHAAVVHEDGCSASDEVVIALFQKWAEGQKN